MNDELRKKMQITTVMLPLRCGVGELWRLSSRYGFGRPFYSWGFYANVRELIKVLNLD
jgi:hypothetical protein